MDQTIAVSPLPEVTTAHAQNDFIPDLDSRMLAIRFAAESVIVFISVSLNLIGLAMVYVTHKEKKSIYHILYINIALSNVTACPITWFWGNLPFFFPTWFLDNSVPTAHNFALAHLITSYKLVMGLSVGIQMSISMTGLGVCQYFAICHPLQSIYLLQKRRAYAIIIVAWVTFAVCLAAPFCVIMAQAARADVTDTADVITKGVMIASNTYAGVVTLIYVIMILLAVMITSSLLKYSKRTYSLARSSSISCDFKKLKEDQRACIATAALLASRTIITVPLTIYFLIVLNSATSSGNTAVFMLSILPCAKCIFDPFIYGSLMRDVNKTWVRMTGMCEKKESYGSESATRETYLTLDRI